MSDSENRECITSVIGSALRLEASSFMFSEMKMQKLGTKELIHALAQAIIWQGEAR